MSWFKVDDQAVFHPKVIEAGNEAFGAFARAGSWSSAHLTEGRIPRNIALMIAPLRVWTKLERATNGGAFGLVVATEEGWEIHDFLVYNPAKEVIVGKREGAKTRMAAMRAGRAPLALPPAPLSLPPGPPANEDEGPPSEVIARVPPPPPSATRAVPPAEPSGETGGLPAKEDPADAVFAAWLAARARAGIKSSRAPVLPAKDKRRAAVARLMSPKGGGFPLEVLCQAARGIWSDPWRLEDPGGRASFELVVRDATHVERFIAAPAGPPGVAGPPVSTLYERRPVALPPTRSAIQPGLVAAPLFAAAPQRAAAPPATERAQS